MKEKGHGNYLSPVTSRVFCQQAIHGSMTADHATTHRSSTLCYILPYSQLCYLVWSMSAETSVTTYQPIPSQFA